MSRFCADFLRIFLFWRLAGTLVGVTERSIRHKLLSQSDELDKRIGHTASGLRKEDS